jgi:hypothetical protein
VTVVAKPVEEQTVAAVVKLGFKVVRRRGTRRRRKKVGGDRSHNRGSYSEHTPVLLRHA